MTGIMQMFVGGGGAGGPGSQTYSYPGIYTWVAPAGVTSVSFVQVGASYQFGPNPGPSSGGGGLGYQNNWAVTPGTSYTIKVGSACTSAVTGCTCAFGNNIPRANGTAGGTGYRTNGGGASNFAGAGGGGAGGYTGGGGAGGTGGGVNGSGGGGGGGSGGTSYAGGGVVKVPCNSCGGYVYVPCSLVFTGGGGGGGTGLYGAGSSGLGGQVNCGVASRGGGGGSPDPFGGGGNGAGSSSENGGSGGFYGGGAGSGNYRFSNPTCASCFGGVVNYACQTNGNPGTAQGGGVRIVWPGATRQFPSTCVGAP